VYRFTAGLATLDLVRFRRLIAEAKAHVGRGEHDQALNRYIEVLVLDHGRAEALRAHRVIRERLSDELGADPGPDLQEAYQACSS
jgi:DNA-binding SARP family transcriptional activator